MALSLSKINQIVSFDVDESKLMDWSKTINKIEPWAKKEDIEEVFNKIFTGEIDFNSNRGVLNILDGLRYIERNRTELKFY